VTKEELLKQLSEYAQKVNTGVASSKDHSTVKNAIQTAYDAGSIPQELKTDLGKKATYSFKNMFSSKGLSDLPSKVIEKGGSVGKFAEEAAPTFGKVAHTAEELGGMGKKMRSFGPLLGMLGAGAMAMGAGQKAMAGDFKGAAGDATDLATDYIPGVGQAKMALASAPLGEHSDEVSPTEKPFDFSPYKTPKPENFQEIPNNAISNSSIQKPNPTRYADLINQISGVSAPDSVKEALKKKRGE
jgi:hypothetical protein